MIPAKISERLNMNKTAPSRNSLQAFKPWEGECKTKPWHRKVTVVIPVMDTFEQLSICIELLRCQSVKPYIVVIDTGSDEENLERICGLRDEDIEVHSLRLNAVKHPSDFPAIAMDLGFSLCRTEYLFATHTDVFAKRIDLLEHFLGLCETESPVVGYQISPRAHDDWVGMVSHTATMYHMPTMDKVGFGWSLRRLCNTFGIADHRPNPMRPCWPDTELLGNYILRQNDIKPHLIGKEENFKMTRDDNIDHFRSFTSGKLYSHSYFSVANEWYEQARKEALDRIEEWKAVGDQYTTVKTKELNG